ncbi:MAG: MFS transporter [Minisyncoccia bacterium]
MVKIRELFKQKMHPVVKNLMISNILALTGWAFISPIFAVYVINTVKGGSIQAVGICYFIYWVVKGLFQIFISDYLDRVEGEADDYFTLLLGQFLDMVVPLSLLLSKTTGELYFIFFIYGIADSLYVPPWNAIFTRYINPKRVSFEWALNSTGFNLGSALAILIGSSLALIFGFPLIFLFVTICQAISLLILLSLKKYFVSKKKVPLEYYFPFKT